MPDKPDFPDPVAQAQNWNDNLGSVIGGFCAAVVKADGDAKDAHTARMLQLLDVPNPNFHADASVIGQKDPLQLNINAPAISLTKIEPILIDTASLYMDMNVSSTIKSQDESKAELSGKGGAKVGWGPFSANIAVSGSMTSSSKNTRESDFRSKTRVEVAFKQGDVPEGLALIMESVNKFVGTAIDINQQIVAASLGNVAAQVQDAPEPEPKPEPAPAPPI